ncbi:MAG: hypothetical protein F4Y03_12430 [Alphaproteobacteria bacterium]|nr:hypothetical protein [Alphaproteobacteria bacterium]
MVRLRSLSPPAALLGALVLATCAQGVAWGHPGGLAQDGCHRVADTDTRHAHAEGTAEPAWFCIDEDGGTVRVPIDPVPAAASDPITDLTQSIAAQALGLVDERDQLQQRVAELEAALAGARADYQLALADLDAVLAAEESQASYAESLEAQLEDLNTRWAERPSARCRNAVQAVLDLEPGGWSGRIKLAEDQRAELRAACLDGT